MKAIAPKIYIILPVYNRRKVTEKFIDCLVAQTYKNYHLILVDDGSSDGTDGMVRSKIHNLTILTGRGDWWWAGSLQQGIDWLERIAVDGKDVVVFMNDDVLFDIQFLETSIDLLTNRYEMLLPQVINPRTGEIDESGVHADLSKLTFVTAVSSEQINCLSTRGLFMTMSVLHKVGGFYPKLLPHYLSDYEFTIRAKKKGVHLRTSPALLISFDESTTGFRDFEGLAFFDFISKYFSKRSVANPIYWTTFALLVSPIIFAPSIILRIWWRTAKILLVQAKNTTLRMF